MALDTFKPYLFVSAGEQSNKFLTPAYADGIAQFQAQRAQPLTGLTVRIDPIQEGSGDPSPTNIRPISGRTGLTVTRAGKNLLVLPFLFYNTVPADKGNCFYLPNGTYTFSFVDTTVPSWRFVLRLYDIDGTEITSGNFSSSLSYRSSIHGFTNGLNTVFKTLTFTLDKEYYVRILFWGTDTTSDTVFTNTQLEIGGTATAYEPYRGASYPISWETEAGTVYGGTLNVTTGVLTVDKVLIDLGSITNWRYNAGNSGAFDTNGNLNPIAKNNDCICTNYKTLENPTAGAITSGDNLICINKKDDGTQYTGYYSAGTLIVKDSRYSDVESFKAAMNGVMLCYTLATPQTYQLTPTEIKTLAGFNQIYSDAGPIIDIKF